MTDGAPPALRERHRVPDTGASISLASLEWWLEAEADAEPVIRAIAARRGIPGSLARSLLETWRTAEPGTFERALTLTLLWPASAGDATIRPRSGVDRAIDRLPGDPESRFGFPLRPELHKLRESAGGISGECPALFSLEGQRRRLNSPTRS